MKTLSLSVKTILTLVAFAWLAGCVQTKPVPGYAKNGDIIVVGLGGVNRNSQSDSPLTVDDLTITLTDSALNDYTLGAFKIFKSYPEYASSMNINTLSGAAAGVGLDLVPFDGGYFAVVALTEQGTTDVLLPGLATGPATISVTSPKLINTSAANEGNLESLPIEILAGNSSFDGAYLQQFGYYETTSDNFLIRPNDTAAADPRDLSQIDNVAGAYFVINYAADISFAADTLPAVVPSGHHPFVQLSYNVIENPDGTGEIRVTLLNPAGFTQPGSSTNQTALLADLSVRLVYYPNLSTNTTEDFISGFTLDAGSSYYIDTAGEVISDLAPEVAHNSTL